MFVPRKIESHPSWMDQDKIKIYTVSQSGKPVDRDRYLPQLDAVKRSKNVAWPATAAFVIFHESSFSSYLVLAWWGNDNELLTHVSVNEGAGWVHDPDKYSFCVWDLEIIWAERNYFIELVYRDEPDLEEYRARRLR